MYINQFSSTAKNPRAQWQVLNRLIGRHKPPETLPVDLPALTVAFAAQVSSPEPVSPHTSQPSYAGPHAENSFLTFNPVSADSISTMLKNINTWKASGSDGIPHFFYAKTMNILLTLLLKSQMSLFKLEFSLSHSNVLASALCSRKETAPNLVAIGQYHSFQSLPKSSRGLCTNNWCSTFRHGLAFYQQSSLPIGSAIHVKMLFVVVSIVSRDHWKTERVWLLLS